MTKKQIEKRKLTILLCLCGGIILLNSLEILMVVKDKLSFAIYQELMPNATFQDFVTASMLRFFYSIFTPLALALYSFFSANKIPVTTLYRGVWGLLVGLAFVFKLLQANWHSIFFYGILILYLALFLLVINWHRFFKTGKQVNQ